MSYSAMLWRKLSLSAQKWYEPIDKYATQDCQLVLLGKQPAFDHVDYSRTATLALPSATEDGAPAGISPDVIRTIFFAPALLRLNNVAQLSTSYLRANLDARHARLSHAIGTTIVLSHIMERIVEKISSDPDLKPCLPSRTDIVAAYTYAALHDAFQGPFGHSLDPLRDCLLPKSWHENRRLDKSLFAYASTLCYAYCVGEYVEEGRTPLAISSLVSVVEDAVAKPLGIQAATIFDWLTAVVDRSKCTPAMKKVGWLFDLLEGPLDADRWDYLWRDTLHLGFGDYHDRVSEALEAFLGDVSVYYQGGTSYLMLNRNVANAIGLNFLRVRRDLYRSIYEHTGKRLIDECLNRCVFVQLLREFRLASEPEDWYSGDYPTRVLDFAHTTDGDLLNLLEGYDTTQPETAISSLYVDELQVYPTFATAYAISAKLSEVDAILRCLVRIDDWTLPESEPNYDQFTSPVTRVREIVTRSRSWLMTRRERLLKEGAILEGGEPILELIVHSNFIAFNPAASLQFARLLWKKAKHDGYLSATVVSHIEDVMLSRTEKKGCYLQGVNMTEAIDNFPPVFATFPWLPTVDTFGIASHKKSPDEERLVVCESNGLRQLVDPGGLMPHGQGDEEALVFAVGFPLFGVRNLQERELASLRQAIGIAAEELLLSGCCLLLSARERHPKYDAAILELFGA